jgi:MFS family permease
LKAARREGALSAVMTGLTDPFMIPYALALGASSFQAGLLSSIRNLLLSLVQLKCADAVAWCGSRKKLVLWTTGLQAVLWIPVALVAPLFGAWSVPALILLYTLGTASAALGAPAWGSLMAEYLRPEERGRYFGERARIVGFASMVSGLAAGGVLFLAEGRTLVGFGLLCAGAAVSRVFGWLSVARFHEQPWVESPDVRFSFWQFVRQLPRSNFARFCACLAVFHFGVNLAAPFFAVYMLKELGYGYATYTAVVLAASVAGFLTSQEWGHVGDRAGNHAVMRWTVFGASVLPLLWPLSEHPLWMGALNMAGAFLWGGLNLSAVNFLYDAVTPPKRHTCLAYYNVLTGIGVSLGAFAGGWAIEHLPPLAGSTFVTVFVVSALVRLVAGLSFHRLVREVRPVSDARFYEVVRDRIDRRVAQALELVGGRRPVSD